jgi:hypothetical protein
MSPLLFLAFSFFLFQPSTEKCVAWCRNRCIFSPQQMPLSAANIQYVRQDMFSVMPHQLLCAVPKRFCVFFPSITKAFVLGFEGLRVSF